MKVNKILTINSIWLIIAVSINFVSAQTVTLIPVQKNGKWGFADDRENVIINCEYDRVDTFKNELAFVYSNCKTIHPHGEDVAFSFSECKQGAINTQGKLVIPIEYSYISDFNEKGTAKAYRDGINYNYYDGYNNGKVGYIDKTGKEIVPVIYTESIFLMERPRDFSILSFDGKVGLLSKEGKIVIPVRYDEIKNKGNSSTPDWYTVRIRLGDKWGFHNLLTDILIEPQFDEFLNEYPFYEREQFLFTKTGNEIWLWNKTTGKKVFFGKYDERHLLKTDNLLHYFQ